MLDPKLASAYYHRGVANEKLGYYSEAGWDYKKTLSIDPNNEDANYFCHQITHNMNAMLEHRKGSIVVCLAETQDEAVILQVENLLKPAMDIWDELTESQKVAIRLGYGS